MGPISPVNVGGADSATSVDASQSAANATTAGADLAQVTTTGTMSQSTRMAQVNTQVSQLLQSVGGGVQNDKVLQMIIALLILIALLQQPQSGSSSSSASDALDNLDGGGSAARSQTLNFTISSTQIAIEQTSVVVGGASAEPGTVDGQSAPRGEQLDLSV